MTSRAVRPSTVAMIIWLAASALSILAARNGKPPNGRMEAMEWCGKDLNPVETARFGRTATGGFMSCKDVILRLDVRPAIMREFRRGCTIARMCYAQNEHLLIEKKSFRPGSLAHRKGLIDCFDTYMQLLSSLDPEACQEYNFNVSALTQLLRGCMHSYLPSDEKYLMAGMKWFKGFMSG
ncbi:uncharacterized protein LOC135376086 [Ornithodoros turicata]|uniref:uncharacterized protein LOC135376086 n=1 Tax=Ornithodoros turicata TaxID=34597 RepID=UPI0031389592